MCSRFSLLTPLHELQARFHLHHELSTSDLTLEKHYNIAPSDTILVLRPGKNRFDPATWGIPFPLMLQTTQESRSSGSRQIINLRAETLLQQKQYQKHVLIHRCLIPCNGFFEWAKSGKITQPFYFTSKQEPLTTLGGICIPATKTTETQLHAALITVPAPQSLTNIHDRFPLVIPKHHEKTWLTPTAPINVIHDILNTPFPLNDFTYYPVNEAVNKPENDSPAIIRPLREQTSIDDFFT